MRPNFVYRPPAYYVAPQLYQRRDPNAFRVPFAVPAGKTYSWQTTTSFSGISLQQFSVPAVAVGDACVFDQFTSPSAYRATVFGDGTFIIENGGDGSRQSLTYGFWRRASGLIDGYATIWINNRAPVWSSLPPVEVTLGFPYSLNVGALATDAEGDVLAITQISGSTPGLALQSDGTFIGTPTTAGDFTTRFRATDITGDFTDSGDIIIRVRAAETQDYSVTVRAFKPGFFGDIYRAKNDTFAITDPAQFSPYWMTFVDAIPDPWVGSLPVFDPAIDREILEF